MNCARTALLLARPCLCCSCMISKSPGRTSLRQTANFSEKKGVDTKADAHAFRLKKLKKYGIELLPEQQNALKYVEGEHNDYTNQRRVMNELAMFCHMCDEWSARGWHDHPRAENETWGSRQFKR